MFLPTTCNSLAVKDVNLSILHIYNKQQKAESKFTEYNLKRRSFVFDGFFLNERELGVILSA